MSELHIPDHTMRDEKVDLHVLTGRVLTDLLAFDGSLTPHIVENTDLLSAYVAKVIGAEPRINWGRATDEEVAQMAAWQNYCCGLFYSVYCTLRRQAAEGKLVDPNLGQT